MQPPSSETKFHLPFFLQPASAAFSSWLLLLSVVQISFNSEAILVQWFWLVGVLAVSVFLLSKMSFIVSAGVLWWSGQGVSTAGGFRVGSDNCAVVAVCRRCWMTERVRTICIRAGPPLYGSATIIFRSHTHVLPGISVHLFVTVLPCHCHVVRMQSLALVASACIEGRRLSWPVHVMGRHGSATMAPMAVRAGSRECVQGRGGGGCAAVWRLRCGAALVFTVFTWATAPLV